LSAVSRWLTVEAADIERTSRIVVKKRNEPPPTRNGSFSLVER